VAKVWLAVLHISRQVDQKYLYIVCKSGEKKLFFSMDFGWFTASDSVRPRPWVPICGGRACYWLQQISCTYQLSQYLRETAPAGPGV